MRLFVLAWAAGLSTMLGGCVVAPEEADTESVGTNEEAIRQGLPTSLTNVPRLFLDGNATCSGVVLAPRIVLTAAHCRVNVPTMRVGFNATSALAVVDHVYSPNADWMLLKLASPGLTATSATLSTAAPAAGAAYSIAGYGNDGVTTGGLLAGSAVAAGRRISRTVGTAPGSFDVYTAGTVTVAGPWPPGVTPPAPRSTIGCPGDSGGPVMRYEQVAPTSWGWRVYGILSGGNATAGSNAARCQAMTETYYVPLSTYGSTINYYRSYLESRPN